MSFREGPRRPCPESPGGRRQLGTAAGFAAALPTPDSSRPSFPRQPPGGRCPQEALRVRGGQRAGPQEGRSRLFSSLRVASLKERTSSGFLADLSLPSSHSVGRHRGRCLSGGGPLAPCFPVKRTASPHRSRLPRCFPPCRPTVGRTPFPDGGGAPLPARARPPGGGRRRAGMRRRVAVRRGEVR